MYTHYFGFNENPFSIAPDPRFLYMSGIHQEALAHLSFGSASDSCIILLTGEAGTGKTTLCRCFIDRLDPATDVAIIINPKLTADELLEAICDEFRLVPTGTASTTEQLIDRLNEYLLQAHADNRQALLVIDEAQYLGLDVIEMLWLLTNLETNRQKLLKIVLLGQSELAELLARPDLSQISQRITSRYHLKGLQERDLEAYIRHRISVAGGSQTQLFSRRAVKEVYRLTRGIPRLINRLCDRSLLGAYSEGRERVGEKIVKKAARELFDRRPHRRLSEKSRVLPFGALALACLVGGIAIGLMAHRFESRNHQASVQASGSIAADNPRPPVADGTTEEDLFSLVPDEQNDGPVGSSRIVLSPVEIR